MCFGVCARVCVCVCVCSQNQGMLRRLWVELIEQLNVCFGGCARVCSQTQRRLRHLWVE